jgi:hypothetical protein
MTFVDEGSKLAHKRKSRILASSERKPIISNLETAVMVHKEPNPAQPEQLQLLSVCISTMFPLAPTRASYLGSWLWHLPPRFGQSKALDYASLSLALIFISGKDPPIRRQAQHAYGLALRGLQTALGDAKAMVSADTLAATLLLTFYEVCIVTNPKW